MWLHLHAVVPENLFPRILCFLTANLDIGQNHHVFGPCDGGMVAILFGNLIIK